MGIEGDALKVRISAAPEKGKANASLLKVLGHWLAIDKNRLRIVAGRASRHKRVCVTDMSPGELVNLLASRIGEA